MNTRLLMTMHVKVATPLNIDAVPHGTRRTAVLSGGTFEGPRLRGTVLPRGSADWQLLRSDGVLEIRGRVLAGGADWVTAHEDGTFSLDLRVTLETEDRG